MPYWKTLFKLIKEEEDEKFVHLPLEIGLTLKIWRMLFKVYASFAMLRKYAEKYSRLLDIAPHKCLGKILLIFCSFELKT